HCRRFRFRRRRQRHRNIGTAKRSLGQNVQVRKLGADHQGEMAVRRYSAATLTVMTLLVVVSWGTQDTHAQGYYRGKTISIFAGRPPGGGVDSEMRLLAHHLAGHIPGRPTIVPKNMPGAGGVALGNHIFGVAAPDGLTLAV